MINQKEYSTCPFSNLFFRRKLPIKAIYNQYIFHRLTEVTRITRICQGSCVSVIGIFGYNFYEYNFPVSIFMSEII
jgi:hypothetical protein